jgi:hypothetical protein
MAKPGTYLGEKFTFEEKHSGDVLVQIGVWEAGAGKLALARCTLINSLLLSTC